MVTPAWRRPEVTELCLAQRAYARDDLARSGIDLRCVVVADDENLEVAARHGFDTLDRDNTWLGAKVNDGFAYAVSAGADFVAAVDSDSWVYPELLRQYSWSPEAVHTANNYAVVSGAKVRLFDVRHAFGLGPMWLSSRLLATVRSRPAADDLRSGLSTSMWNRLLDANRGRLSWEFRNVDALQYLGLRSRLQITNVEAIASRWPVRDQADDWAAIGDLRAVYPADLVGRVEDFYAATPHFDRAAAGQAVRTRVSKFEWAWRRQDGTCGDCKRPVARNGQNARLVEDDHGIRVLCARCEREAAQVASG
jgi:hypothetical protein